MSPLFYQGMLNYRLTQGWVQVGDSGVGWKICASTDRITSDVFPHGTGGLGGESWVKGRRRLRPAARSLLAEDYR